VEKKVLITDRPRPVTTSNAPKPGQPLETEPTAGATIMLRSSQADLAKIRGEVEAKARAPRPADIVAICDRCGYRTYYPATCRVEGTPCGICGGSSYRPGGKMRLATPEETRAYWAWKKESDARVLAQMRQVQARSDERARLGILGTGVPPIDRDETIKRGRG
jgi:hypothetical protein